MSHASHTHGSHPAAGETFGCPMHPEVTADHASRCPKCGMNLVPAAATTATGHGHRGHDHRHDGTHSVNHPAAALPATPPATKLCTCPMHPEIVRDRPGRCPICGMRLEPVMPDAADDFDRLA